MATIRSSMKNFERANKARWWKDWGFGGTPASIPNQLSDAADQDIDYAASNGFMDKGRTADGTDDVYTVGVDADNNIRYGGEAVHPMRTTFSFPIHALTGTPTQAFFVVPAGFPQMLVVAASANFGTANGATLTATITHESALSSTSGLLPAPGAGSVIHNGTINLNATANTPQNLTIPPRYTPPTSSSNPNWGVRVINPGDTLSIKFSGAVTSLADLCVSVTVIPGAKGVFAVASMALNAQVSSQSFFVANSPLTVKGVCAVWSAAGTAGGTVTGDVQIDSSGTAPGSGTTVLAAAFSLKTAANTPVNPALTATAANLNMVAGSKLSFVLTGTATTVAGLLVIVWLQSGTNGNAMVSYTRRKEINWSLKPNTNQATQIMWGPADQTYELVDASCVYDTAAGGALKGAVTIDAPGVAPGSGTIVQTDNTNAGFDLNTTTNTPLFMTPAALHLRIVPPGSYISLKLSAAKQSLAGLAITVSLRPQC